MSNRIRMMKALVRRAVLAGLIDRAEARHYGVTLDVCSCPHCDELATTTDDSGNHVCSECTKYWTDPHGDTHCECCEDHNSCPDCAETIAWGPIQTGAPGAPNHCAGTCACVGRAWERAERGPDNAWIQGYTDEVAS